MKLPQVLEADFAGSSPNRVREEQVGMEDASWVKSIFAFNWRISSVPWGWELPILLYTRNVIRAEVESEV